MEDQDNPFLQHENYFAPYEEKIKDLRNQPEVIEFDKLCFELFEANPTGKKFLSLIKERYLMMALVQKNTPTYQIDVLWQEGFKDAFRMLVVSVTSHQQRIIAGANKT